MSKPFSNLRKKMSPQAQKLATEKMEKMLREMRVRSVFKSLFHYILYKRH